MFVAQLLRESFRGNDAAKSSAQYEHFCHLLFLCSYLFLDWQPYNFD
jgi:hypothetical protein